MKDVVSVAEVTTVPDQDTVFEGEADFQFDSVIGMTAADALREGAKKLTQSFGSWGNGRETGCALTAMHRHVSDIGYK